MNIQSVNSVSLPSVAVSRQSTPENASPPDAQLAKTAAVAPQAQTSDPQPSRQQLDEAVQAISDFVSSVNNSLQFSVDDTTGKTIVKVIDSNTQEVVKQIPSEEMLVIAKALDGIKGLLVQQKA